MSARHARLLGVLLALTLAACGAAAPSPTAAPQRIPLVEAVTPALKAKADSYWLESREGSVIVELQQINLAEPGSTPSGEWVFRVALTESGMDAPPLTESYEVAQLAYLVGPNGQQVNPASWAVYEEGHMGHHVKGTLVFAGEPQAKTIRVVIGEIGGVTERVFEWPVAP